MRRTKNKKLACECNVQFFVIQIKNARRKPVALLFYSGVLEFAYAVKIFKWQLLDWASGVLPHRPTELTESRRCCSLRKRTLKSESMNCSAAATAVRYHQAVGFASTHELLGATAPTPLGNPKRGKRKHPAPLSQLRHTLLDAERRHPERWRAAKRLGVGGWVWEGGGALVCVLRPPGRFWRRGGNPPL